MGLGGRAEGGGVSSRLTFLPKFNNSLACPLLTLPTMVCLVSVVLRLVLLLDDCIVMRVCTLLLLGLPKLLREETRDMPPLR